MGRNIYLSDKEINVLRNVCIDWIETMENRSYECEDEEYIDDMKERLNNGLGSALRKICKDTYYENDYKDYK